MRQTRITPHLPLWRSFILVFALAIPFVGLDTNASAQPATAATVDAPKLKTLNDHFPFAVPETVDQWRGRADELRCRVQVATGLWPTPERTTISPVIHGRIERDGFIAERVYFESLPGHFVTGMLFRPSADNKAGLVDGKRPAVLCPHGHGGRTQRLSDQALEQMLKTGAEKYEESGRYPKIARCAHLARLGCVTFMFDMLGYADSQQIDYKTAHRHADPRAEEAADQTPCFYSMDADLKLQSIMGLQVWNAIRCLDFLADLPDVDRNRIGVTGSSGGGTQTILLGAMNQDVLGGVVKVSFPNGMVSTSMQGGCYCENCNYLRVDTGNVELAALVSPNPQGMTAANDWTKDMLTDGFPELKKLYTMLGYPERVMCGDVLHFPHNYNYVTRSMMYPVISKHLGLPTPAEEGNYEPITEAEMQVWTKEHPQPTETGPQHEQQVLSWWTQQNTAQLSKVLPLAEGDAAARRQRMRQYDDVVGKAWRVIFDRSLPAADDMELEIVAPFEPDVGEPVERWQIKHKGWSTQTDVDVFNRSKGQPKQIVLAVGKNLDACLADVTATDSTLLDQAVIAQLSIALDMKSQPLIDDSRTYSGFTFTYNRTETARRCNHVLTAIGQLKAVYPKAKVCLVADQAAAPAAIAAASLASRAVDQLIVRTDGVRLGNVKHYSDVNFVPGAVKYFDLPGLLALRAPAATTVLGETQEKLQITVDAYGSVGAEKALTIKK
ncbi:Acetyl xylan esterase (AXE1) [Stieleria bergensis]|uniref:Acetyl xylan esterase (AXE1) n=1 Tax=Stieleria bergensis TaxID=2528025 RepID=A0A517SSK4_9BACT|nr:Acetyl xylan esterase (AXE1) [Planctomycetes bacterium SV_7m_r]